MKVEQNEMIKPKKSGNQGVDWVANFINALFNTSLKLQLWFSLTIQFFKTGNQLATNMFILCL